MRSFLINKNLCFYYWLRKRIGKTRALGVANAIENIILISGRKPSLILIETGRQTKSDRIEDNHE